MKWAKIASRALCLSLVLVLAGCDSYKDYIHFAVGTYTDTGSFGIYTYSFNRRGWFTRKGDSLQIANPSYLTFNSQRNRIYAVSENNESTDSVTAISYEWGKLKVLNSLPTNGEAPCFVETNDSLLLVANYFGGSMSAFKLNPDGSLKQRFFQYFSFSDGPDSTRQNTPHVHTARFTPDGKHFLATDFSADLISSFSLDEKGKIGDEKEFYSVSRGSGPRHIEFSPDGRAAYVLSELSGAVTVFSYYDGKLKRLQEIQSDTVGGRGSADIHISPDGKFLYTSNRLKADGIRIFRVNKKTHLLTSVGYQPTGKHPRNFCITGDGRWLFCACRDSDEIEIFQRNKRTGMLTNINCSIKVKHPVCVKIQ